MSDKLSLRRILIKTEKINSFHSFDKSDTVYVDKNKNCANVNLSNGQVKQNKLRII